MAPDIFQPASEISTSHRCDNCGVMLDQVEWTRCILCKLFHLCKVCDKIPYHDLPNTTLERHRQWHSDTEITVDLLQLTSFADVDWDEDPIRWNIREEQYRRIMRQGTIKNDFEMAIIMKTLSHNRSIMNDKTKSLITDYHLKANERKVNILSLDGGGKITYSTSSLQIYFFFIGVRGYMPIKILTELLTQKYLPNMRHFDVNDDDHKAQFHEAQTKFTQNFDYFVGTSTGGLIAFCLAIGYNILDLIKIYSESTRYFKRNAWLGPLVYSKYDPSEIHAKIHDIINGIDFPGNQQITAENATLLDIRNLLNPDRIITAEQAESMAHQYNHLLEFTECANDNSANNDNGLSHGLHQVQSEKVLLITSYNTTKNCIAVFNTSYAEHWGYRIADVLKATMAAPTYFPPHKIKAGVYRDGHFSLGETEEMFIDGGVFANDPELAAIWAVRMQWKKPTNYHLFSIGTGTYTSSLPLDTWGGYVGWIFNGGMLVNTLMDATRSFIEIIAGNLAKFDNMRRMKLNYKILEAMNLDDPTFVNVFDKEWVRLKGEPDFKTFGHFFETYILREK